jgi:predicted Zn-dependent peptidase
MSDTRQHAHELIDQVPDKQLSTVVGLPETIVDPAFDDEEISEEEEQAVARSKEWFKHNPGTPFDEFVAELAKNKPVEWSDTWSEDDLADLQRACLASFDNR